MFKFLLIRLFIFSLFLIYNIIFMKKKNDNREMQIIFMENFNSSSLKIHDGWALIFMILQLFKYSHVTLVISKEN